MLWNQEVREIKVLIWQSNCSASRDEIAIFLSFWDTLPRKTPQNGLKRLLHSWFYGTGVEIRLVR